MQSLMTEHITKTPGVCGGRACIKGHRIRVLDIVVWHEMRGMSPAEIAYQYPGLTAADVHSALTYYFDNIDEINDEFKKDEECSAQAMIESTSKIPPAFRNKNGG